MRGNPMTNSSSHNHFSPQKLRSIHLYIIASQANIMSLFAHTVPKVLKTSIRTFSMTARRTAVGQETVSAFEHGANYSMNLGKAQGIANDGFISGG